jgi:transposase
MANVLNEEKKQQVLALGRLGWPLRKIQQATRIRRETASQYLKAAGIAVRPPGGWGRRAAKPANEVITDFGAGKPAIPATTTPNCNPNTNTNPNPNPNTNPENLSTKGKAKPTSKPANEVITDSEVITNSNPSQPEDVCALASAPVASPQRSPSASACEPYREAIELGLSRGRNAVAIWQDLVDEYGFASSYQSVQRFVRKLRGAQAPEARGGDRHRSRPGSASRLRYRPDGARSRNPQVSAHAAVRDDAGLQPESRSTANLPLQFAHLGRAARTRLSPAGRGYSHRRARQSARGRARPRHLRSRAQSALSRCAAHYGAVAMPCRIQDPDRKGKVEAGVGHAQKTPLKGLRFESLEEAQAYLDRWEERWADTRIHGTTKRQVAAMFAEEKPALLPLPVEPFRYYQYGERIVHLDGCVEVEAAYYGAPPGWIGRMLRVQWDELFVRLLDPKTGQLLREHVRQARGWYRIKARRPPQANPAAHFATAVARRSRRAHIGALCAMHRQQGEVGVRRILGVLSLAKKYGTAVDEACAAALEWECRNTASCAAIWNAAPQAPLSLQQVDPLIRELSAVPRLHQLQTKEIEE